MLDRELVCVVGFDLDGTLYKKTFETEELETNAIAREILQLNYSYGTIEKARAAFQKYFEDSKGGSKTMALARAANIRPEQASHHWTEEARIEDVLQPDFELAELLAEIQRRYTTYLLTSSTRKSALKKLEALCINPDVFCHRYFEDTEDIGSKSKGSAYQFVLKQIGISAQNNVYVGDTLKQDILSPKSLGIQTIAVWNEIPEADLSIKTIYDLKDVLIGS